MNFLLIVLLVFLFGCAGKEDSIKVFIPGTYVHSANSEFSTVWDTLTILPISETTNQYLIKRYASYLDLRGVPELHHKKEEWDCLYKEIDKVLFEQKDGKVIALLPEQNALRLGKSQYKKIN